MMWRSFLGAACGIVLLSSAAAEAPQSQHDASGTTLADVMIATQARHIKLWFAGKLLNWGLAAYELDQIRSKLKAAAALSTAIHPDRAFEASQAVQTAIDFRDNAGFVKAYTELTNACNACHRESGFGFISLQVPLTSPFTDELFADQIAEGRGLAHMICGACHVVNDSANEVPVSRYPAPSFGELIRRPSFNEQALRQMLSSNHRNLGQDQTMRNPRLADYQIDEIVAYFDMLRARSK